MKLCLAYSALFIIALLIRLAAFAIDMPFRGDVFTFQSWAVQLYEGGLSRFYYADTFTDYPPMYMYLLWLAGAIRYAFELEYLSPQFNFIVFLPAIISDIITGLLIYRLCRSVFAGGEFAKSFWIALAYLTNPAVILNSSVWGQVDAIHTLLLFLSLYALSKKQSLAVYLLYGIAVLTKPQSLIVAPIFLYSAFYYFKERDYSLKAAATMFGYAALTFLFMALLSLPFTPGFDLSPVLRQYADTLGSYPFASVNAYNFIALTGGNWQEITLFYTLLSVGAIVGITCMTFWILHKHWPEARATSSPPSAAAIFYCAALLFIVTFVFSVRMHERYLFPALLFLLLSAILMRNKSDIRFPFLYAAFSLTLFVNCLDVLLKLYGMRLLSIGQIPEMVFRPIDEAIALVSFINVALAVFSLKIGRDIRRWTDF